MALQELAPGVDPVAVDIVFVHGLRGDALATWTEGTICWPRDLLPDDLANARIMAWGYDSSVAKIGSFSSHKSIFGHADSLLGDLVRERRGKLNERPIVFVGHSLGGLVIKEALGKAHIALSTSQNPRRGGIYTATAGVVFMGTPHRGSAEEKLGVIASLAAWALLRNPNDDLIRTLAEDSPILERQRDHFVSITEKLKVVCLYEESPMPVPKTFGAVSRMIVPQHSACYDGFHVTPDGLPGDHLTMCKFASKADIGYKRTSGYIIDLVDAALEEFASRKLPIVRAAEEAFLQALYFPSMKLRIEGIDRRYKKTFSWIFDTQKSLKSSQVGFVRWLREGSGIYWINGKAGSGKSTLMKYIRGDPETQNHLLHWAADRPLMIVDFFFSDQGDELQKSLIGMLRGVLHQILSACPTLIPVIFKDRWEGALESSAMVTRDVDDFNTLTSERMKLATISLSSEEVNTAFTDLLSQLSVPARICIFIDGLDEYGGNLGDHRKLANLLKQFSGGTKDTQTGLKICASSRPLSVYEVAFQKLPGFSLQYHSNDDISFYVEDNLRRAQDFEIWEPVDQSKFARIIEQVVQKASGVFLWVRLAVDSLLDGLDSSDLISELQARVNDLPDDLEAFYERMILKIEPAHRPQALTLFNLVVYTPTPLSLLDLSYIVDPVEDLFARPIAYIGVPAMLSRCRLMEGRLKSRSAGLLEVIYNHLSVSSITVSHPALHGQIQFLHLSVKDYLQLPKTSDLLKLHGFTSKVSIATSLLHSNLSQLKFCGDARIGLVAGGQWRQWRNCFYFAKMAELETNDGNIIMIDQMERVGFWTMNARQIRKGVLDKERQIWHKEFMATAVAYRLLLYLKSKFHVSSDAELTTILLMDVARGYQTNESLASPYTQPWLVWPDTRLSLDAEIIDLLLRYGASKAVWSSILKRMLNTLEDSTFQNSTERTVDLPTIANVIYVFLAYGADVLAFDDQCLQKHPYTKSKYLLVQLHTALSYYKDDATIADICSRIEKSVYAALMAFTRAQLSAIWK